jgi:outer membrane lipoprotein SlyB
MKCNRYIAFMLAAAIFLFLPLFASCTTSQSGQIYSSDQAQRSLNVYYGTIIELRQVTIQDRTSGGGAVVGGVAGGVLGSTIGSGRGRTLATVGGALAGLAAGNAIEKQVGTKPAVEFTIELDNGQTMAVVQEDGAYFRVGDRVKLLQGEDGTWRVSQ